MKFTLIGCGVLGGAILDALITNKVYKPEETIMVEQYPNQNTAKFKELGSTLLTQISELTSPQDLILVAVKPQQSKEALLELRKFVTPKTLVMSIMAGIPLSTISTHLGPCQLIRIMPNTPCQIHIGMSCYYGNKDEVSEESFKICEKILTCMGKALKLDSEKQLDPVTAVSGSGPAYVFYLAEAMQLAAKQFGFNDDDSRLLAQQTLLGAANLLATSKDTAGELRKKVTSPGGTTEAAINSFDQSGIKDLLIKGMDAARLRSIELAKM